MKEIRVGIIGAGTISHRHMNIYANIQRHARQLGFTAKVVACAELIPEKLKAWGAKYGIGEENLYTDFRKMLERDDIDTIDICTFHNLHTPLSILAMKAGKDVYCEKPSAASYRDAVQAIEAAKKLGRKFHIQLSTMMTPQTRKAKQMITEGKLGDIYYANLEFISRRRRPGYDFPEFSTDFYSKRMSGHGQGLDGGSYLIGQMVYLLGMPKLQSVNGFACHGVPVKDRLVTNPDGFSVEDLCDGFAKFEGGIGFHYTMASALNYKDYSMTYIAGSKGGLELTSQDMGGGAFARAPGAPGGFMWKPELKFYGEVDGQEIDMELRVVENGRMEQLEKPEMLIYNDNQVHWLAYKLGIIGEEERYNTPAILAEQLLITDGIFLSNELGRSVTRDEIIEMSPTFNILSQEIDGETVHYDLSV